MSESVLSRASLNNGQTVSQKSDASSPPTNGLNGFPNVTQEMVGSGAHSLRNTSS